MKKIFLFMITFSLLLLSSCNNENSDNSISKEDALEYIDKYLIKQYTYSNIQGYKIIAEGVHNGEDTYLEMIKDNDKLYIKETINKEAYSGYKTSYIEFDDSSFTQYFEEDIVLTNGSTQKNKDIITGSTVHELNNPKTMVMYSLALVDSNENEELTIKDDFKCNEFKAKKNNNVIDIDFNRTCSPSSQPDFIVTVDSNITINIDNNNVDIFFNLNMTDSITTLSMEYNVIFTGGSTITMPNPNEYKPVLPNQQLTKSSIILNLEYFVDLFQADNSCFTLDLTYNNKTFKFIKDNNKIHINNISNNIETNKYIEYNKESNTFSTYIIKDELNDGSKTTTKEFNNDDMGEYFTIPENLIYMVTNSNFQSVIDDQINYTSIDGFILDGMMTINFSIENNSCTMIINTITDQVNMTVNIGNTITYTAKFTSGGYVIMPDKADFNI